MLVALILAQSMNLNNQPLLCMDEGAYCRADRLRAFEINCSGAGITCTQTGGRMTLSVSGGGAGGGAPVDGGYVTFSGGTTGSTNERTLTAGTNIAISTATPGQVSIGVTGTVSAATTATQLASDPTACSAGQYVTDISAAGALTCSTPPGTYTLPDSTSVTTGGLRLTGDLGGTATSPSVVDDSHAHTGTTISALDTSDITTGTLAGARGGLGATQPTCAAGDFVTCNGSTCSCSTPSGGGGGLTAAQVSRLVSIGGP